MKKLQPIQYISPLEIARMPQEKERFFSFFSAKSRQQRMAKRLAGSDSFSLIKGISTLMDTFMLDPIIGFFFPGLGDLICSILAIPFISVSLFRVRSIALTLTVIGNILVDLCVGAIPIVGDILDVFIRSSKKNYTLIVGYAEGNPSIVAEVKNRAIYMGILCVILGFLLYFLLKLLGSFWTWIVNL